MKKFKSFKCGDDQCYIEVYPKGKKHNRSHFDIFRMILKGIDEEKGEYKLKQVDMTPDEALLIASNLTNAVMFWLFNYKPYDKEFMKEKRKVEKKFNKLKK